MEMTEAFRPSILMSETHFPHVGKAGVFADAIERVAAQGFYREIEFAGEPDPIQRRRIARIVRPAGLAVNWWTSFMLVGEGLSLCSLDEPLRSKSVRRVIETLEPAAEAGATGLGVLSGPDPGPAHRPAATEALFTSLCRINEAMQAYKPMFLFLEPLDRGADKNYLIGPTAEFNALIRRVRAHYPDTGISWDTAHVALNGDDLFDSLARSKDIITQVHLANPVTDENSARYGDSHPPFGPPGALGVEDLADIFAKAVEIGLFGRRCPYVSVEIRTPPGGDPWRIEDLGRRTLQRAWEIYQSRKVRS